MSDIEAMIDRQNTPYLYSFARMMPDDPEFTSRRIAARYDNVKAAVNRIEYVAEDLRDLHAQLRERIYNHHSLEKAWKRPTVSALQQAITDAELNKEFRYALELGAIQKSHVIDWNGHLHAFQSGHVGTELRNAGVGAALFSTSFGFAAGMPEVPPAVAGLVVFGCSIAALTGATLAYTNLATLNRIRVVDPFIKVASELEKRATYIRETLNVSL